MPYGSNRKREVMSGWWGHPVMLSARGTVVIIPDVLHIK
jgi:hypothetical protein